MSSSTALNVESPVTSVNRHRLLVTSAWVTVVISSFVAGRFLLVHDSHDDTKIQLTDAAPAVDESISITVGSVMERPVQRSVNAVGSLHAYEEIVLATKLDGRVAKIYADVSQEVRPGDVLLELDATDAQLAVEQAEQSLQAELTRWGFDHVPSPSDDFSQIPAVMSARAKHALAKSRLERVTQLYATKSVSTDDLEQAKSDLQVFESEWRNQQLLAQSAAASARLRGTELAIAKQRLKDCKLLAPQPTIVDPHAATIYTISERLTSEGTYVRQATEVFRLVLGTTLKLRLLVPETYAAQIRVGQKVLVYPVTTSVTVNGTVAKVAPAVDRATRTFMVEVEVPNKSHVLKPGGFAKASILLGDAIESQTVPTESLYSLAGIQKVFVIENGVAKAVQVKLGEQTKEWIEIVEPKLAAHATVATSGQRLLSDGVRVAVREEVEPGLQRP